MVESIFVSFRFGLLEWNLTQATHGDDWCTVHMPQNQMRTFNTLSFRLSQNRFSVSYTHRQCAEHRHMSKTLHHHTRHTPPAVAAAATGGGGGGGGGGSSSRGNSKRLASNQKRMPRMKIQHLRRRQQRENRNHGRLQVYVRVIPQKAIRCDALPPPCSRMGIQAASLHPPRQPPLPSR